MTPAGEHFFFFTKLYAHNLNSMAIKHFNVFFLKDGLRDNVGDKTHKHSCF